MQEELLTRAVEVCLEAKTNWNQLPDFDRFGFIQQQARYEVQKFWKRLRKQGLSFKYIAAFENDQSGKPHMHCLLHETHPARQIRKRELEEGWDLGFSSFKLLYLGMDGGLPHAAIMYVTKSIAQQRHTRLCASFDYRPERQSPKSERLRQLSLGLN